MDYSIAVLTEQGPNYFLLELHEINRSLSRSRKENMISNHETTVEMIRGLSHEIKNPLGGIRGAAQLLALQRLADHAPLLGGCAMDSARGACPVVGLADQGVRRDRLEQQPSRPAAQRPAPLSRRYQPFRQI